MILFGTVRIRPGPYVLPGLALVLCTGAAWAAPGGGEALSFFRNHIGLSDEALERLRRGEPVTRTLGTSDGRDISAFGAIRVRADRRDLIKAFHDIEVFKRSDIVLEIGKFSEPPRLSDLEGLSLTREDFDDLRECRPGDCGLRLGADDMARLRKAAEPRTPQAFAESEKLMRQVLFDRLQAYVKGGNAALAPYADEQPPLALAEPLDALLTGAGALSEYAPDLLKYLSTYPSGRPTGTDEFFYWSKEKFARKPVVSLTHVVIRERLRGTASVSGIISKQLYASHYFDASLGSSLLFDDPEASGGQFFLVYLNRSRNPGLGGFLGPLVRPIVRGRVRDGMSEHLMNVRARIEQRTAAGHLNSLPSTVSR